MHVISRAEKESIEIGEDITVTVLEIHDDSVRVGISASHHEPCYREVTLFLETSAAELLLN